MKQSDGAKSEPHQQPFSLAQKVLRYQATGEGRQEIINEVGPLIYNFPRRTMRWDEDACGDFYVFMHERIIRLLDRFKDQGKPFEIYLFAVLGWQVKNFARERKRADQRWKTSLHVAPGETVTIDHPPADDDSSKSVEEATAAVAPRIVSAADRRNFLFYVLKGSRFVDESNGPALARIAGITPETLLNYVAVLQELVGRADSRRELFRGRRNAAYAAIRFIESQLVRESDTEQKEALTEAVRRMQSRMRNAIRHGSRVVPAPTNKQIAAVLGVPKGTVDSGLFWLRKKLQ